MSVSNSQVQGLVLALFGASAGGHMTSLAAATNVNTLAGSLSDAVALITGKNLASNSDFRDHVTSNLKLTGEALTAANAWLDGQLNASAARGDIVAAAVNYLLTLTDATSSFFTSAQAFQSTVSTAVTWSTGAGATVFGIADLQAQQGNETTVEGVSFTLTAADDNPVLTAGDDTISGTSATLSADDRIADASTTDADLLNLTLTADPAAMDVRNIENINIDWNAYQTLDADLDSVLNATVTVASAKVGFGGSANFTNVGSNAIVAGAGFTSVIKADAMEDSSLTATVARTVTIGATEAADGSIDVVAPAATSVSVTGGDDVSINAPAATSVTVSSAGADTVALSLGKTSTVTTTGTTSDVEIKSATAITVTLADTSAFDTLVADSTISLRLADSSDFDGAEISGPASVRLSDAIGTTTFDAELFDTALIQVYAATGAATAFTLADGAAVQLVADNTSANDLTFKTSTTNDGSADEMSLTVKAAQANDLTFDTADQAFETVNLTVDNTAATTLAKVDVGTGTLNLASNQNVTLTLFDAAELNASTMAKTLTVTQSSDAASTIIAGSSVNTATFAGTSASSAYVGGAANDTVTFVNTTGDASAVLGNGVNDVTADAITTGTLALLGGTGNDTLTVDGLTTGTAIIDFGAGTNTVTSTATATGYIEYTGGAGNDTLTLAASTATVKATTGDGINSLTANSITTGTLLYVGGEGNDTVSASAGTSGSFNVNVAGGSANSVTLTATTGKVTVTGGDGIDTVALTTLTTGSATIDTGAGVDSITVGGTFAAAGSVNISAGAGNDTVTYESATATSHTTVIDGGDGTDTLTLGGVDYTDGTITLSNIEVLAIGSNTTDTVVDGALLTGATYTITGDGTATDQMTVHLDVAGTYDFSGIGISAVVGTALGGLAIAAQTAAISNVITATAGNDSIDGGSSVDTITGGTGADTIDGGTGNDVFVLGTRAQTKVTGYATATGAVTGLSIDYLEDFLTTSQGTDKIQLSTAANAYATGLTLTSSTIVNVVQVAIDDTGGDTDNLTELAALVETAATGVASSAATLRVYVVSFTNAAGDLNDGQFIFINDNTAGIAVTDTIIAVGTTTLSDIVSSSFTFG